MIDFESAFEAFLSEQKRSATGMRREMLDRDLTGTKKLCEVLLQAFGSFDPLMLEYELAGENGVKIYADVYHRDLRIVFEANGYDAHAEKITRDRHSFEQMRVRTFTKHRVRHLPYSWDDLDKRPEMCLRSIFEALGRFGGSAGEKWMSLTVYDRELIRCAMVHPGPFAMADACEWLQLGVSTTRRVMRKLVDNKLISTEGGGPKRFHRFRLSEEALRMW